jgi:hypothetical protein
MHLTGRDAWCQHQHVGHCLINANRPIDTCWLIIVEGDHVNSAPETPRPMLVAAAAELYERRLHAYVIDHLPRWDWASSEDLVQETLLEALLTGDLDLIGEAEIEAESGLPAWLSRIARAVVRRHSSPATGDTIVRVGFRGDEAELAVAAQPEPTRPAVIVWDVTFAEEPPAPPVADGDLLAAA